MLAATANSASSQSLSAKTQPEHRAAKPALFTPLADFLLLGGGSLILIVALTLFLPSSWDKSLAFLMLIASNVINHPHFAHSYQIFYDGFRHKAFGGHYSKKLRARYVIAGLVVPCLLVAFFISCFAFKQPNMLGYGLSAMAFFVGWHYVKQGYGILMLQSAITGRFFKDNEKKLFLINAYATWILSWLLVNNAVKNYTLHEVKLVALPVPEIAVTLALIAASLTFLSLVVMVARNIMAGKQPPWTGLMAYGVAVYPWLLLHRGMTTAALIVPAAHSLQYLTVVWRYQLNREKAEAIMDGEDPKLFGRELRISKEAFGFASFVTKGTVIGFLGFWAVPMLLDFTVPYDHAAFGSLAFLAIFWMFINIHHYFLDSVMWRRENADMKKYLFVAPPKPAAA
jgi:hypothetical protein